MEETAVPNLRSRSRSKTPLIQLNRDREDGVQTKSGRRTPVTGRDTPTRSLTTPVEVIVEDAEQEVFTSPPAHRTRNALRQRTTPIPKTGGFTDNFTSGFDDQSPSKSSQYLSEEHAQNVKNYSYEYERIATSTSSYGNEQRRSFGRTQPSPSDSDRSNESFAESILADSCRISGEGIDHLPYKVYKNAGEYWNKYPKTDYTYSRLSKDRVELAPGQVAVPNMSRPSLHNFRGTYSFSRDLNMDSRTLLTSSAASSLLSDSSEVRNRWNSNSRNSYGNHLRRYESISDTEMDEVDVRRSKTQSSKDNHWWITQMIITVCTTIVTTTTTITSKVLGRDRPRYLYSNNNANYRTYATRTTEETSWYTSVGESVKKRRWWILLLLLLLLPFAWWLYGGSLAMLTSWYPRTVYSSETYYLPMVDQSTKFELTDDIINAIVMRVKQSLPTENSAPQIIEKIIEKSENNFDPSLITRQQALIDQLTAEINLLKAANKPDDEETRNILISKHTTRAIVQLLGLSTGDGSTVTEEDVKRGLLKESQQYIDEKLIGFQRSVTDDIGRIAEGVKMEIKDVKKDFTSVLGGTQQVVHMDSGCQCDELAKKIVLRELMIYDADKTGLVDYALESAGGQVVSTRCTESYQPNSAVYSLFGIPFWYPSNSPRTVITPGTTPGECWAFKGFPGYLVIKLFKRIKVTGFTLEHTPSLLSPHGKIESALNKFTVWGLQDVSDHEPVQFGSYEYLNDSTAIQYFPAAAVEVPSGSVPGHELVEIRVESNHGNPVYTCLYRFRVHGDPVDEFTFFGDGPDR